MIGPSNAGVLVAVGACLLCLVPGSWFVEAASGVDDDFYSILGVERDATTREIRKGFKRVALIKHPDKNRDDPDAHDKFLRINRAYEVLKDDSLRKIYNEKGEKGLEKENGPSGNNYQNWNFYKDEFGIYDDDIEISTLSKADFQQLVLNTDEVWFVNFYSPRCSHCHTLAPTWREVGRQMEGVIHIGAVNCMDEWSLCNQQGINSYPSIMEYPKNKKYKGDKSKESLIDYMLRTADIKLHQLTLSNHFYDSQQRQLVTFCGQGECLSRIASLKLTSIFKDLISVSSVDCDIYESLCLKYGHTQGTVYFDQGPRGQTPPMVIDSLDVKEISSLLLQQLPSVDFLSDQELASLVAEEEEEEEEEHQHQDEEQEEEDLQRQDSSQKDSRHLLLHFIKGVNYDLELKKLTTLLGDDFKFAIVDCTRAADFCSRHFVVKPPSFALLRRRPSPSSATFDLDVHYGRPTVRDVAAFARNSAVTPCRTLTSRRFPLHSDTSGQLWFIDFFAPWCPPCMKLLPDFRKASSEVEDVNFGVIDCTIHQEICQQYDISSYPTTIIFNDTQTFHFNGEHTVQSILEFVADIQDPPVAILDDSSFKEIVMSRSDDTVVAVDFFAPWCGPCQQLAPAWRQLAKQYKSNDNIVIASVDCTLHNNLCQRQGVGSYPTIKAFHMGTNKYASTKYTNWQRDVFSLRNWVKDFLPQIVKTLDPDSFQKEIVDSTIQTFWLVDFYSPWCGPCKRFAPVFEEIAMKLKDRVNCATVNCQKFNHLCQSSVIHSYPSVRLYLSANDRIGIAIEHSDVDALVKTVGIKVGEKKKELNKIRDEF